MTVLAAPPATMPAHRPSLPVQGEPIVPISSNALGITGPAVPIDPVIRRFSSAVILAGSYWVSGGDLILPICVRVAAETPGQLVVTDPRTSIFGGGSSLPKAIDDFRAAIIEHRDVLEDSQPLSTDLQEQLDLLRQHLRPRG